MNYLLSDREPKQALRYFEEISQIPRGSGNERLCHKTWLQGLRKPASLDAPGPYGYGVRKKPGRGA